MLGLQWLAIAYLSIGCVSAVVVFLLFAPVQGYRPSWTLRICAFGVYTLLWPLIVLLAAMYGYGMWYHRRKCHGTDRIVESKRPWHFRAAYHDAQSRN